MHKVKHVKVEKGKRELQNLGLQVDAPKSPRRSGKQANVASAKVKQDKKIASAKVKQEADDMDALVDATPISKEQEEDTMGKIWPGKREFMVRKPRPTHRDPHLLTRARPRSCVCARAQFPLGNCNMAAMKKARKVELMKCTALQADPYTMKPGGKPHALIITGKPVVKKIIYIGQEAKGLQEHKPIEERNVNVDDLRKLVGLGVAT